MKNNKLLRLVIHCTATKAGRIVTKQDILDWHTLPQPRGRGWHKPGYSAMIHIDGSIETIVDYNEDDQITYNELTNGASGFNNTSRHIVIVGGLDENGNYADTLTNMQRLNLIEYCRQFKMMHPDADIVGHCDLDPARKSFCPGFKIQDLL